MQTFEQRKKSVPGTRDIITQIRSTSDKIQKIENEIKEIQDKISAINEENRAKSPRAALQNELRELNDAIKNLKFEKWENYNQLDSFKNTVESLKDSATKDKNAKNLRNPEEIEKRIEQLNLRLIVETVTPKDEKEIAVELLALRTMKSKLGGIEDSMRQLKSMDASCKECKTRIAELSMLIAEKTTVRDRTQAELEKLSSADKAKNPEVVKLEASIAAHKTEKQKAIEQKNVLKEEVRAIEAEFAKFEQAFTLQQKLEDKKAVIKKSIATLRNKKEELQAEAASFDPKIFDSLSYAMGNLRDSKDFNIDIGLVSSLIKYGINIPTNAGEVEETLKILKEKRNNSMSIFKAQCDEISSKLAELDAQIETENSKLGELPPTDFDLLKKGQRLRKFN